MIDFSSYPLPEKNYYYEINRKKQIVLGNSFNKGMNHFNGWLTRSNGSYKKSSTFTIDRDGKIYQHFDPKYYSDFLPNSIYNNTIISVSLVNEGWFDYDILEKKYINWYGYIYSGDTITEKRWRNHSFWENYTEKQFDSTLILVEYLINKFNIKKNVMGHNTQVRDINNFEGISYRSNWIKDSTDLSPAWEFNNFKTKIEDDGI